MGGAAGGAGGMPDMGEQARSGEQPPHTRTSARRQPPPQPLLYLRARSQDDENDERRQVIRQCGARARPPTLSAEL